MNCPKCGKPMVKRNGKFGPFMGCSGYPNCKTIVNIGKNPVSAPQALRRIEHPSKYQQKFEDFVRNGKGNGLGMATAGSGKTRTEEHLVAILIEDMKVNPADIIYLAFNSHVVKEAVEKGLPARTTHSVGFEAIRNYDKQVTVTVDGNKVPNIVKNLLQMTWDDEKWMVSPVASIVSKLKNTLAPWDNETQSKICDKFGIEVNGSSERIFDLVRQTMEINNADKATVDFDDQIYLPIKFKMEVRQYKWVLGDEVQDWNRCQIELIKKIANGRVLCVGDKNQSMYGFRGAAPDAMDKIKEAFNAEILPLSISYRNPKSHVRLINAIFPEIVHEMWDNAIEGEILTMSQDKMLGQVKNGDLVICRNNAPLVEPVFSLIRQGIKAVIRGRDIGTGLVNLVERFKATKVVDLLVKMEEYRIREVAKLMKAEKNNQAESLNDKVETIVALSNGCDYVWQITQKIEEVFSDKNEGVIFSTVHRAKGDEAERVFILNPQLMPSKWAKDEESQQQERNVLFVALSRSKHTLVFVGGPAPTAFESTAMWEEELTVEEVLAPQVDFKSMTVLTEDTPIQMVVENAMKEATIPVIPNCPF